jgi:phosphatidylglycerophosphate synthase
MLCFFVCKQGVVMILFAISTFQILIPFRRLIAMRKINPNWLTASRMVVFAPLALGLLCLDTQLSLALCLVVMLLAELTDALDGALARATGRLQTWADI